MINIHKLSLSFAIGVLILVLCMFEVWQLSTETAFAQDEGYSQEFEDNYESPQYEDPLNEDNFAETQPEPVDPEFMEEIEPGEFDQSDDVTELDDNNY